MAVVKSRCPVPPEQLPINQYQDISQSWFYSWGRCDLWAYTKPLLILWGVSWIIAGPVSAASFMPGKQPISFVIWASTGALVLPVLTLIQLYVGWIHIGHRLKERSVFYEESGWYDGQIWEKPDDVMDRDQLIMTYEVQPILKRVRMTLLGLLAVAAVLITAQQFL